MTDGEPAVLYDERDDIAIITINRPHKKNTLTDAVIQGLADGIDAATKSSDAPPRVVVRGTGRTLTGGYDLTAASDYSKSEDHPHQAGRPPYGAKGPKPREGAWDPVRDYQFMNNNVRRFMKIWECPKPVIGEISGWAVGGATDMVLCADLLFMADDAHIGYAPSRIYGTPTTMMWVHRLGLEHAKQFLLTGRAIDAETAHRIGLVSQVVRPTRSAQPPRLRPAGSPPSRPISSPSTNCSSTRPTRTWGCVRRRCSERSSTASPGTPRRRTAGPKTSPTADFKPVIADRDGPWQDYSQRPDHR